MDFTRQFSSPSRQRHAYVDLFLRGAGTSRQTSRGRLAYLATVAGPLQDPCRTLAGPLQDPCRKREELSTGGPPWTHKGEQALGTEDIGALRSGHMPSETRSDSSQAEVQPQLVNTTLCTGAEATRLIQQHGAGGPRTRVVFHETLPHANNGSFSRIHIPVLYNPRR